MKNILTIIILFFAIIWRLLTSSISFKRSKDMVLPVDWPWKENKVLNQIMDIIIQHYLEPSFDKIFYYGRSLNLALMAKREFSRMLNAEGFDGLIYQSSTHGIQFQNGMKVLFRKYEKEMHQEYRYEEIDNSLIFEDIK